MKFGSDSNQAKVRFNSVRAIAAKLVFKRRPFDSRIEVGNQKRKSCRRRVDI